MTTTRGQHLIGKVLGSCVIERLLGYGGTSAVFLAQQHTPEQKVAIKVFLPRSHLNAQMQKDYYSRFLLEAEAASRLDHPNIRSEERRVGKGCSKWSAWVSVSDKC